MKPNCIPLAGLVEFDDKISALIEARGAISPESEYFPRPRGQWTAKPTAPRPMHRDSTEELRLRVEALRGSPPLPGYLWMWNA